jgi:putative CocE/NonD family hydrolase
MRDGVRLSTDIFRPTKPGQYPVILFRNPYGNGTNGAYASLEVGYKWAKLGYVYVHQDVRGRYDSEGKFYTYTAELADGYDAQQWAGSQDWSSGKVGTLGLSYMASVQWLSAHLRAPSLTAMIPMFTPFNYYKDVAFTGGAFALASRIGWGTKMGGRTLQLPPYDWERMLMHLPLKTMDKALGVTLSHWQDWIAHPSYDTYWQEVDVEARIPEIQTPSFNIGGWYDIFLNGTLTSYEGMRKHGRTLEARQGQKLMIGPWPHGLNVSTELGELDFGPDSLVDMDGLHKRWFEHWLKGDDTGFMDEPPVRIFVMGENQWRSENEWPLARTQYQKYYFHSQGKANTATGDGKLSTRKPKRKGKTSHYQYDPENPVPTHGGAMMFKTEPAGPFDQAEIEQREDVLVFSTEKLKKEIEVTGPVKVTLYAASSALDTDFTAKLVDVHPNGKAYNLVDGIIRARYRKSFETPELLEAGKIYQYTIDLWATSNVFKQGHRIRVDISSSNFPRFDRNPNTGHKFGEDAELQTATQTIHHSAEYPSHITLPIIPR